MAGGCLFVGDICPSERQQVPGNTPNNHNTSSTPNNDNTSSTPNIHNFPYISSTPDNNNTLNIPNTPYIPKLLPTSHSHHITSEADPNARPAELLRQLVTVPGPDSPARHRQGEQQLEGAQVQAVSVGGRAGAGEGAAGRPGAGGRLLPGQAGRGGAAHRAGGRAGLVVAGEVVLPGQAAGSSLQEGGLLQAGVPGQVLAGGHSHLPDEAPLPSPPVQLLELLGPGVQQAAGVTHTD